MFGYNFGDLKKKKKSPTKTPYCSGISWRIFFFIHFQNHFVLKLNYLELNLTKVQLTLRLVKVSDCLVV